MSDKVLMQKEVITLLSSQYHGHFITHCNLLTWRCSLKRCMNVCFLSFVKKVSNTLKFVIKIFLAQIFKGNFDRYTVVRNTLNKPVITRYIRIHPEEWNGHISMRTEFYGCSKGK